MKMSVFTAIKRLLIILMFCSLRIVIAARDLAPENQQRIGKTVLVIEVIDENDNPPTVKVDVIVEWNGSAGTFTSGLK